MARIATSWENILLRVKLRLISQISEAKQSTCIISDNPDDLPPKPGGKFFFIVSPPPSYAFTEQWEGGEDEQAQVHTTIVVTVHSTAQMDAVGRAEQIFTHASRGLFPMSTKVLKAMLGHDLEDANGDNILNEPIHPSNCSWRRGDRARS